jgi:hypothetical protein
MLDKRRHRRFKLDLIEFDGKLSMADKVEIVDMSFGGVALKVDRRLNIGKEYLFKLGDKENSIDVQSIVVRCKLSGIEERFNGEKISIYTAGMRFKDGAVEKVADFVHNSIIAA